MIGIGAYRIVGADESTEGWGLCLCLRSGWVSRVSSWEDTLDGTQGSERINWKLRKEVGPGRSVTTGTSWSSFWCPAPALRASWLPLHFRTPNFVQISLVAIPNLVPHRQRDSGKNSPNLIKVTRYKTTTVRQTPPAVKGPTVEISPEGPSRTSSLYLALSPIQTGAGGAGNLLWADFQHLGLKARLRRCLRSLLKLRGLTPELNDRIPEQY